MLTISTTPSARRHMGQRGDTIVEVLIATAIVSMVLATAFTITNRNVQTEQNIQEQAQAQKLVSQQLESLRLETNSIIPDCYLANNIAATAATQCRMTAAGVTATSSDSGAVFDINIAADGTDTYVASATWQTVGGLQSSIKMYYHK